MRGVGALGVKGGLGALGVSGSVEVAEVVDERRFVLPSDVELWPSEGNELLGLERGEVVVVRPGSRLRPKVVPAAAASLLERFRTPATLRDAVRAHCAASGGDPVQLLVDASELLVDLSQAQLLAVEGTAASRPLTARRHLGDRCGPVTLTSRVRVLRDGEIWRGVSHDGRLAAVKSVWSGLVGRQQLEREVAVLQRLHARAPGLAPTLLWFAPASVVAVDEPGSRSGDLAVGWAPGVAPDAAAWHLASGPDDRDGLLRRRLALRVVEAYASLHESGVLHGDVHPGNVRIDTDAVVTLIDFGLARVPGTGLDHAPRAAGGEYVDPQAAAALLADAPLEQVSPASEQYSVAAMVWRMLTSGPYLELSGDRERALRSVVQTQPESLSRRGAAPWPGGEMVLRRALAKHPEDRHGSLHHFATALAAVVDEPPVHRERPRIRADEDEVGGRRWRLSSGRGAQDHADRLVRAAERDDDLDLADLARAWALR